MKKKKKAKKKSPDSKKSAKSATVSVVVNVDNSKTESGSQFSENEADRALSKLKYSRFL